MVQYDYFPTTDSLNPEQERKNELAKPFHDEMELAFFVVEIGMSPSEYRQLTEVEKSFIKKQHETNTVTFFEYTSDAVFMGEINANRKKNASFKTMFKKKQAKANKEYNENATKLVFEIEEKETKSWVDLVYKKNGLTRPL